MKGPNFIENCRRCSKSLSPLKKVSSFAHVNEKTAEMKDVVVFCEMSSLVSEKTNSMKISIFAYFRLFNKYKTQ